MTIADIAARYASVFLGLTESETAAIWQAVLFGRTPSDERLRGRIERLETLRDDVGRSSAARSRNGRSDAA